MLLYFYTDWCRYCRQVERDVFAHPDFDLTLGRSNIRVRVNPEAGLEDRRLADRFGVKGYPSFFAVLPGRGEPVRCSLFRRAENGDPLEPFSVVELQKEIETAVLRHVRNLVRKGYEMKRAGNRAGAADAFDRAIAAAPGEPDAWLQRGLLRAEMNRLDEALADYARVAALRTDGKAHDHAVYALLKARRYDAAVACATDWIGREPDSVRALRQRAWAHKERGDLVRARADRERACAQGDQESCVSGRAGG